MLREAAGNEMKVLASHEGQSLPYRKPPLTFTICPVMNSAAGEERKRAARATSSGVPQRPARDSRLARSCQCWEAFSPQAVLIQPGARQLTRTPGASDCARLFVKLIT